MMESAPVLLPVSIVDGSLPLNAGTTLTGTLDLEGLGCLRRLPSSLTVHGDLRLRGTEIEVLPQIVVVGSVELEGCLTLKSLANGIEVGGDLDLEGCHALCRLPEQLKVGGNLYLAGTKIRAVPASVVVAGQIYGIG